MGPASTVEQEKSRPATKRAVESQLDRAVRAANQCYFKWQSQEHMIKKRLFLFVNKKHNNLSSFLF